MKRYNTDENPALEFISHQHAISRELEDLKSDQASHQAQDLQDLQQPPAPRTQSEEGLVVVTLSLTPVNLDFLQVISKIKGTNVTEYINQLIKKDRIAQSEAIEEVIGIVEGAGQHD